VASGQPLDRLRPDRLSSIDLTMQGHGDESREALDTKGKGRLESPSDLLLIFDAARARRASCASSSRPASGVAAKALRSAAPIAAWIAGSSVPERASRKACLSGGNALGIYNLVKPEPAAELREPQGA
jgi:hypothetical protein